MRGFAPIAGSVACLMIAPAGGPVSLSPQIIRAPKHAFMGGSVTLRAMKYGAPPPGGIAFGLDRLVAILGGQETIRDFIAFPKNNSGRDVMIDAPAPIDKAQLDELGLKTK